MANENETVMDVCAEWRDCIESADPSVWNDERIAGLVKTTKAQQIAYLDRIVAAWKREKAEIEADALSVGGVMEAARHKPGNAAEMRDALRALRDASRDFYNQILNSKYSEILDKYTCVKQGFPAVLDLRSAFPMANAALSAPERNCDAYKTPDDCMRAFESYVREHGKLGFINPFTEVVKWLLAPAAELKGESDGSK